MVMKIHKILNNNVAVVLDEHGDEKIVMGKGICFKKKAGKAIDPEAVDKVFSLSEGEVSNKFQVLVQDIPMEHMALGEEIIAEAKMRLGKRLNEMIYISLIDHVHTSIIRFHRRSHGEECAPVGYSEILPGGVSRSACGRWT